VSESQLTRDDRAVIENFLATLPTDATLGDAMAMAEDEARASRLSRIAARALGAAVRSRYARIPGLLGGASS
jgi:hypothetical protein